MRRTIQIAIIAFSLSLLLGCREEAPFDKYARPDWLAGKLFTQIADTTIFDTFSECLHITGFDTIINTSGSYTVFAPDEDAFDLYFEHHPKYKSVSEIPPDELRNLVKYHIVQNPWSKQQLVSLDVWGWIDSTDASNDKPKGFKRQTLLLEKELKFGVFHDEYYSLRDTTETSWHRKIVKDSRKFAPVFFEDYFGIYDLKTSDYEYYFGRPIDSGEDLYFAGAKIVGPEIFAENGFIYRIDRVVEPLRNAYQILNSETDGNSYDEFLELIKQFPEFDYNEQKTFDQAGYDLGLAKDSLFDLRFPDLAFNVVNEKTKAPTGTIGLPADVSIRYHHGIVAPTNAAMAGFSSEFFEIPNGWGSIENAPINIKRIIANTHMAQNPIYPTDIENGFYNGERDLITFDPLSISHIEFGSNSTFVGVDQAIAPRAFSSITGAVYLKKGFSVTMNAIENAGLLSSLKRQNEYYTMFVESDFECKKDSSLLYNTTNRSFSVWVTTGIRTGLGVGQAGLRTLLMNHVAVERPRESARVEFIKNLAGNFLIFNNETGNVTGTASTTAGYQGTPLEEPDIPVLIKDDADNGIVYSIKDWFSFSSEELHLAVRRISPAFDSLMVEADLTYPVIGGYTFVSDNEFYTVILPTRQALVEAGAYTLEGDELKDFLKLHFIVGDFIFTDGNQNAGYYETARIDKTSTQYSKKYSQIYIEPDVDILRIADNADGYSIEIPESEDNTNILTGRLLNTGTFSEVRNTGVIHISDKALKFEELDTTGE